MHTPISIFTRMATREENEPLNILTFCTHERYETGLAKTGHNFYAWRMLDGSIKDWDETYAPVPNNYTLLNPQLGGNQLPSWVDFDLILSQNKFGQYQIAEKVSKKLQIPLISLEHTLPIPGWDTNMLNELKNMKGDVNIFISKFSRKAWGWGDNEAEVIHHGIDTDLFKPIDIPKKKHVLSVVNDWINREWCKPAGQKILTSIGYIPIENIKVGNYVLTDDGKYHQVVKTFSRDYFGDMIEIKLSRFISIKFTPTHNIRVYRDDQWQYVDATKVRSGDILRYPKHQQTDFTFNDEEMAWLIGLIIGDGSINNQGNIEISCHKDETEIIEKSSRILKNILGNNFKITIKNINNITKVNVTSKTFGIWLKTLIKNKGEKSLPDFIVNGSNNIRLQALQGLWAADGSFKNGNKHGNRACYSTISPKLASQVSAILHSFGIRCSITRQKRTTNKSNGTELPIYRITSYGSDNFINCFNLITKGQTLEPYSYIVEDVIIHREWSGKVYNCEVDKNPSYVVYPGFVAHNCCNFTLWQNIVQGLPVFPVGKTPGLSKPAKDVKELVHFYNEAQVFVNTSSVSPIPTVLLEAMSCGCAVVSTATCMIPEIITNGYNGYISNNPQELRNYLLTLLDNPSLCHKLGQNARKTIVERFSIESFINNWNKILYDTANRYII